MTATFFLSIFMTKTFQLSAATRTKIAKAAKHLREVLKVPAVVYGRGIENKSIEVDLAPFRKVYSAAGESSLVDLSIDGGAPVKVLIHDIQVDPLRGEVTHIDFLQVNMNEKLTTEIAIEFVKESAAVKALGGTLVKNMDHIEVKCLPGDLVHAIEVDISKLATFEDVIRVKDITPPAGIEFLSEADAVIALVEPPRSEEEMKALESEVKTSVEDVAVVEKKKKEEDDAAAEK